MPRHATAPVRLQRELRRRGLSYRSATERLAIPAHFAHLQKVATGDCEPRLDLAVAIERELGIAVEEWPSLRQPVTELLQLRGVA